MSWALGGTGLPGDGVHVAWLETPQALPPTPTSWMAFLAPGTTAATYPALPSVMESLVPEGASLISVRVIGAGQPSQGIDDLFAFEWTDQLGVSAPSTQHL